MTKYWTIVCLFWASSVFAGIQNAEVNMTDLTYTGSARINGQEASPSRCAYSIYDSDEGIRTVEILVQFEDLLNSRDFINVPFEQLPLSGDWSQIGRDVDTPTFKVMDNTSYSQENGKLEHTSCRSIVNPDSTILSSCKKIVISIDPNLQTVSEVSIKGETTEINCFVAPMS